MTLLDQLSAEPAPIRTDADGVARVGGTRVRLETVVVAFNNGASAEEILLKYPSLDLKDIYSVIAYYLWRRPQIDAFLNASAQAANETREQVETRFPSTGIRERLLARRSTQP